MRRAKYFHAMICVLSTLTLVLYWGLMAGIGRGSWLQLARTFRVGPFYVSMFLLSLATLIVLPACLLSLLRLWQLRGHLSQWNGLAGVSTLMGWQALALAVVIFGFDTPWPEVFKTNWIEAIQNIGKKEEIKLSDEGLEYPGLPLQPPDYYAWSVFDSDGKEVPMASFRGKPLLLSFWATWCVPCRAEMPSMQHLYELYKDKNVSFAFVTRDEEAKVQAFLAETHYTFPVYFAKARPPATLGVSFIPTTLLFDASGRLAYKHSSAALWDTPKTTAFLDQLSNTQALAAAPS